MKVKFFNQPYLLYLYSIDKYTVKGSYKTLRAKDYLTLVFAEHVSYAKSPREPEMEYNAII